MFTLKKIFKWIAIGISVLSILIFVVMGVTIYILGQSDQPKKTEKQSSINIQQLAQFGGDIVASDIKVVNNYAYINVKNRNIKIFDISHKSNSKQVGVLGGGSTDVFIYGFVINGNYAYVMSNDSGTNSNSLTTYNISNKSNPEFINILTLDNDELSMSQNSMVINGNYLYLAKNRKGFAIIDISNPSKPKKVGFYKISGGCENISIKGNYTYTTYINNGSTILTILDTSNPSDPKKVGFYKIDDIFDNITINGNYVYLIGGDDTFGYPGFVIIDISNPSKPKKVGFYKNKDVTYKPIGMVIKSDYAYVCDTDGNFVIFDTSNPSDPRKVKTYNIDDSKILYFTIDDDYVYIDTLKGLTILDISNPSKPKKVGFRNDTNNLTEIKVYGNYAYVSDYDGEFMVINVNNPFSPKKVGSLITGSSISDMSVQGDYAYISDSDGEFIIINIGDPCNPKKIGSYKNKNDRQGIDSIAVHGHYAYLAYKSELEIIDISNPSNLKNVGSYKYKNNDTLTDAMVIDGNYLYLANFLSGLAIFDISNPSDPIKVASYKKNDFYATSVTINGNYAYVGSVVFDISNPSNPRKVDELDYGDYGRWSVINGNYAYYAQDLGFGILDISTPSKPKKVLFYDTSTAVNDIAVQGNYIYLANGSNGLIILKKSLKKR